MDTKAVAGVAGQPQASNSNGCDSIHARKRPVKTAGNPAECRTSDPVYQLDCKARRTADKADRMRIDLTKAMVGAVLVDGNDAVTPFLRRQMTDVMKPGEFPKPKHRVAAKTEVTL
jgi:hypothetical protein